MLNALKQRWAIALAYAYSFLGNTRGESLMSKIIGVSVALVVFSIIGVMAVNNLMDANTSAWDTQTSAVYAMLPVMFILGIAIAIIYAVVKSRR